jgi:hypothetical protein
MKRLIVALVVGGMLFAAAWAAAAGLIVDVGALQAGSDDVLTCDHDPAGVQIYFRGGAGPGIAWDETLNDFIVTDVVVGGIDSSCDGLGLKVVLTDINGDGIASGSVPSIVSSPNPVVPVDHVPASAVYDVHVLIQE